MMPALAIAALALFATTARAASICIDAAGGAADVPASLDVGDTIDLSLPGGDALVLSITAESPGFGGRRAFSARVGDGPVASSVVLSDGRMYVEARNLAEGVLWKVSANADSVSAERSDLSKACRGGCIEVEAEVEVPEAVDAPTGVRTARMLAKSVHPFDDVEVAPAPVSIDMMLVFDNGAREWISGLSEYGGCITNFAVAQVARMNAVLENTGLQTNFWYRLVEVMAVDANMASITQNSLSTLKDGADSGEGPYGEVKTRRDACGADCVSLIIDTGSKTGTTGVGYTTKGTNAERWATAFREWCYSICAVRSVADEYTLSHEVGHNMGLAHSKTLDGWVKSTYEYANGYNFEGSDGRKYHTIMAYDYDHAGGSYTYGYVEIPYFSSPVHSYAGVPVGSASADATRTLRSTCQHIAKWRDNSVPYNWEVAFLDSSGMRIPGGTHYFSRTLYVTLTNYNSAAEICYTIDGGPASTCRNGERLTISWGETVSAYTVVGGVAQPSTMVEFREGQVWSGEAGRDGGGAWIDDGETLAWGDSNESYDKWMPAVFGDIEGVASATVSVHGAIAPYAAEFTSADTAYVFEKGAEGSSLRLSDAVFAPRGDLTFNLPVRLEAVAFTNPANRMIAFNAPFGQTVSDASGYCTNMIGIGSGGTLVVSPGDGKTQTFDFFNNTGWFYNNATFRVGTGTVVFKGPVAPKGLFGSVGLDVTAGARVVLDIGSAAYDPFYTANVSGGGTIESGVAYKSSPDHWGEWTGTVAFEGLAADSTTRDFQFENYGGAGSRILLRNCALSYLCNNNATFPGTLVLEGEDAFSTANGYSGKYNAFGALEGDGSMKFTTGQRQAYVFNVATNYTGAIHVGAANNSGILGGRTIVFGEAGENGERLPTQSATITVQAGATASIGARWHAHHGVEIGGTLVVKGPEAALDCATDAAMGLMLDDGATLLFAAADSALAFAKPPAFAAGTNYVELADGVEPFVGKTLVTWPEGGAPAGDFAFASPAVASEWALVKGASGLVVERAPLPEQVLATISLLYYGDDGWTNGEFDVYLPSAWVTNHYPALCTASAVAAKYGAAAANGAAVWQCYMLGLDPTDAKSTVSVSMSISGGKATFSVNGLGETHGLPGVKVYWYLRSTDDLAKGFSLNRAVAEGLSPSFAARDIPDRARDDDVSTAPRLFYKIKASFVSEGD